MAQIVTITNPLTGQPAQVDQLDHTAQQIDDYLNIARLASNPNLLGNWYLVNPVNQRGVTSGNTTPNAYFIDRWMTTYGSAAGTYSLDTGGVTLTPASNNSCAMFQRFENADELDGKVLTASVLLSGGELFSGTITRVKGSLQWFFNLGGKIALYMNSGSEFTISVYINPLTIKAAKLELGDQQTLAHQDSSGNWVLNEIPDYGEQLLRCQRYFQTFATESLRPANALDFRPVMRENPALSTITVDGKTLYTANADL